MLFPKTILFGLDRLALCILIKAVLICVPVLSFSFSIFINQFFNEILADAVPNFTIKLIRNSRATFEPEPERLYIISAKFIVFANDSTASVASMPAAWPISKQISYLINFIFWFLDPINGFNIFKLMLLQLKLFSPKIPLLVCLTIEVLYPKSG